MENKRPSPQEMRLQIRNKYPDAENSCDFLLYTDGSGYTDPYGGYSAMGLIMRRPVEVVHACAAVFNTDTERMEFEALLNGIQAFLNKLKPDKFTLAKMQVQKPTIVWFTDRESLALAVWRDENGEPFYSRRSTPDLWRRFEYYEELFHIIPLCVKRDTVPAHKVVDEIASGLRVLIKEWHQLRLSSELPPT